MLRCQSFLASSITITGMPQFSDRVMSATGMQTSREVGQQEGICGRDGCRTLQIVRDRETGSCDGRENGVPLGGPAQVHVQPAARAAMNSWLP